MVRALAVCSSVLALWPSVAAAQGAECTHLRPTDPDAAWTYAGLPAKSFDTPEGHFRVWFVDSGAHAPALEASRPDGVPDVVAGVGAIAEAALSHFAELGYREPITDADYAACASNGGDGRLDVYLMNFGASDGTIVVERCAQAGAAEVCSGFSIVENDFSIGIASRAYASFEQAARTVVPHELFHLVQAAYDRDLDAFWTEGTAQWATKTLYPELRDLERF